MNKFTRLTLGSRVGRSGLLELDVLSRSPSAATTRDRIQTETDVVDIVDVAEIDGTADDEGPGGFLLRAVVRPIARGRRVVTNIVVVAVDVVVVQGRAVHMRYGRDVRRCEGSQRARAGNPGVPPGNRLH